MNKYFLLHLVFFLSLFPYLSSSQTSSQNICEFPCTYLQYGYKWKISSKDVVVQPLSDSDGRLYFRIKTSKNFLNDWNFFYLQISLGSVNDGYKNLRLRVNALMRIVEIGDSVGAGISIHLLNKEGHRIDTIEERLTEPTKLFIPITLYTMITHEVYALKVGVFLHRNIEIEVYEPQIDISAINGKVVKNISLRENCNFPKNKLIGFGVEDDGRFYDRYNQNLGVDKRAVLLREARLNYLHPHWVRTFVWFKEWSPNGDGTTFTWNSDGILSLCKTLDYYQSKNIPVNLTCVTWGMKDPWDSPEIRIQEIIALLNFLIKEKRFTCIKYFTLTNEPNYFFQSDDRFEKFVKYHKILHIEFLKHKFDIKLIGSDDAMGTDWFYKCLSNKIYRKTVDLWASHFYWNKKVIPFAYSLFKHRFELLEENDKRKPFVVTEFGITDSRFHPPFQNPYMEEFEGALLTVSAMIDGLNAGVTGFSIWCLHEVAYPGGKDSIMRMGLWGYLDKNWKIFPIYHALAMFTRNTNNGDYITPIKSSAPEFFKAVKIGEEIFWSNISDRQFELTLPKFYRYKFIYIYTASSKGLDKIRKEKIDITGVRSISIPPRSFGYLSK